MLPDGRAKLDVRAFIWRMEGELRRSPDPANRARILATLRRWQWDEMLDAPSRARARALARELDCVDAVRISKLGRRTAK